MTRPAISDLKIKPEYACYSFWVANDGIRDNVDPASLGIPSSLVVAIDEWELVYEATYVREDPASSGFADEEQESAFNFRGRELATMTANALGPGWSVHYYDFSERQLVPIPYSGTEAQTT
jgi:hypothetical protein